MLSWHSTQDHCSFLTVLSPLDDFLHLSCLFHMVLCMLGFFSFMNFFYKIINLYCVVLSCTVFIVLHCICIKTLSRLQHTNKTHSATHSDTSVTHNLPDFMMELVEGAGTACDAAVGVVVVAVGVAAVAAPPLLPWSEMGTGSTSGCPPEGALRRLLDLDSGDGIVMPVDALGTPIWISFREPYSLLGISRLLWLLRK